MKNIVNGTISQYDIWFANLKGEDDSSVQHGKRPVLVVSNNIVNLHSPVVTVVPLTSKNKKNWFPTHVNLFPSGLKYPSMALCEQIRTIDKSCLINKLTKLSSAEDINAVNHAIMVQLNIAE